MGTYQRRHESVLYPGGTLGEADTGAMLDRFQTGDGVEFQNPELARQIAMGNGAAADYVKAIAGTASTPGAPTPHPEALGTPEWYDARHADCLARHPEVPPPSYYLHYGKKYCLRFSEVLFPKLTPEGQAWLVKVRTFLQLAIEDALMQDPVEFDMLEGNEERFKRFAFDSHPQAYLDAGLSSLPEADMIAIGLTVDIGDIATMDGIRQVMSTSASVARDISTGNNGDDGIRQLIGQDLPAAEGAPVPQLMLEPKPAQLTPASVTSAGKP